MAKITKIQIIKRIIKITVALAIFIALAVLVFFAKHNRTFENADMSKWLKMSEIQRLSVLYRVAPDCNNRELLLQCVTKIAQLPDSDKMDIRDAIAICYNGIKINKDEK